MVDGGLVIMAVGMTVVFAFLAVMVVTVKSMSGIIQEFFPEAEETAERADDAEIAIAVAAAHSYN